MSEVPTITKLAAAHRQLGTAIRLFFADDDPVAVHTLACAAREIYEKHCRIEGRHRMFDFVRVSNLERSEKELWNLLNAARNFFKHEGDTLEDSIEFDDSMNDFQILSACVDCQTLCGPQQPAEVQAFTLWFLAVDRADDEVMAADPTNAEVVNKIQTQIDARFPGLRTAPRAEKKRFGATLVRDALAGKRVERITAPSPSDIPIGPNLYVAAE
ncbi:MAG TPA: hypothetical protein VGG11_22855 [Xanthobacteraceae bacterium]|jgi:hypothetical protein